MRALTSSLNQALILVAALCASVLLAPSVPRAQTEGDQKAEMLVRNYRGEPIKMEFAYVFREYTWALMEREIGIDGDLIYKFPTNLPGCEYLIDWGIDRARLTISNSRQVICSRDVSICEKRTMRVDVREQVCRTRVE